jgi:hypothetical protein
LGPQYLADRADHRIDRRNDEEHPRRLAAGSPAPADVIADFDAKAVDCFRAAARPLRDGARKLRELVDGLESLDDIRSLITFWSPHHDEIDSPRRARIRRSGRCDCSAFAPASALAADPDHPIKLIVPFAPVAATTFSRVCSRRSSAPSRSTDHRREQGWCGRHHRHRLRREVGPRRLHAAVRSTSITTNAASGKHFRTIS